jgi:phosphohistidine phosphatase SixA
MNPIRLLFFLLALAAAASVARGAAPTVIFVVRHGEKSAVAGDVPLSERGRARAEALARMFGGAKVGAVYSSELTFARETAAPIAARHGLTPVVVPVKQADQLVAALRQLPVGSVAVVVNHSGNIPAIVEGLGGARPAAIDVEEFDRILVVARGADGVATVAELNYQVP